MMPAPAWAPEVEPQTPVAPRFTEAQKTLAGRARGHIWGGQDLPCPLSACLKEGTVPGKRGRLVPEQILVSTITDTTFPVAATGTPHSTQTTTGTHAPAPQGAFWPPFYDKQENRTQRVSVTGLKTHSKMQGPDSKDQTQSPVFPHPVFLGSSWRGVIL